MFQEIKDKTYNFSRELGTIKKEPNESSKTKKRLYKLKLGTQWMDLKADRERQLRIK